MLSPGLYPASVTPFDERGRVDPAGVARLLAWFEASGCQGVVLAGTNGEGPSLSAVEKRDLLKEAAPVRGKLELILGIATPSLHEAVWLSRRAEEFEAAAILVMPPMAFRDAPTEGIRTWFLRLLDDGPAPALLYNHPRMAGIALGADLVAELAAHERVIGLKDSSGEVGNLIAFRQAIPEPKRLFVGDETLLLDALANGWNGTISGAANVLAQVLSTIVERWSTDRDSAQATFDLVLPLIRMLRYNPQPALNKGLLHAMGILETPHVRPPLVEACQAPIEAMLAALDKTLGSSVR